MEVAVGLGEREKGLFKRISQLINRDWERGNGESRPNPPPISFSKKREEWQTCHPMVSLCQWQILHLFCCSADQCCIWQSGGRNWQSCNWSCYLKTRWEGKRKDWFEDKTEMCALFHACTQFRRRKRKIWNEKMTFECISKIGQIGI